MADYRVVNVRGGYIGQISGTEQWGAVDKEGNIHWDITSQLRFCTERSNGGALSNIERYHSNESDRKALS